MTDLEADILRIIKAHVGFDDAINQYKMTQRINDMGEDTNCRQVRKVIEDLIK